MYQLIRRDIRVRYKQAVIGAGWAFFIPAVVVLSGLMVRSVASYLSGAPFDQGVAAGLMAKSLPWVFFTSSLNTGTASIAGNYALVSKVYFPRVVLPIASTAAAGFDTAIGGVAIVAVLGFLGVSLTWAVLWIPVLAILLISFTLACALLFSCLNVFFRDVKYLIQVVVTFGIFFTPVFFEPEMLGEAGRWLMLNPVAPVFEGIRLSLIEGVNLIQEVRHPDGYLVWHPLYLVYCTIWSLGGLAFSWTVFRWLEVKMAEYV